jgi:hypothetical protein
LNASLSDAVKWRCGSGLSVSEIHFRTKNRAKPDAVVLPSRADQVGRVLQAWDSRRN